MNGFYSSTCASRRTLYSSTEASRRTLYSSTERSRRLFYSSTEGSRRVVSYELKLSLGRIVGLVRAVWVGGFDLRSS